MASTAQVTALYQELLGRSPDAGGLKFYSGFSDPNAIRTSITGSTEYKTRTARPATPAPNPSQPLFDFANSQKAEYQTLLDRQKGEQQGLFNQYTQKIQDQEQLPALYQRLQKEQGIPDLSQQAQAYKDEIYRVKGLLDRLDEDVTSRNLGTYTTQALRDRIAASEGGDLRTQLSRLGTGLEPVADMLTSANQQVSTLLPLYTAQQAKELQPLEMQINTISDRFAREITGFTQNRENMLTAITDKLERERQLSDREWELAQQLAAEERAFARQKATAASTVGSYLAPRTAATSTASQQPQAAAPTIRRLPTLPAPASAAKNAPAPQPKVQTRTNTDIFKGSVKPLGL